MRALGKATSDKNRDKNPRAEGKMRQRRRTGEKTEVRGRGRAWTSGGDGGKGLKYAN